MNGEIICIGIGNGGQEFSIEAIEALKTVDVVLGFDGYVKQAQPYLNPECHIVVDKEIREASEHNEEMMKTRAKLCYENAQKGLKVAYLCGGDINIYTPSFMITAYATARGFDRIRLIPGISFVLSTASKLGLPLNTGFALVNLTDFRDPRKGVINRVEHALAGDFVLVLYAPKSEATLLPEMHPAELFPELYPVDEKNREIFDTLVELTKKHRTPETPIGVVGYHTTVEFQEVLTSSTLENNMDIDRIHFSTAGEMETLYDNVGHLSVLVIGNSNTIMLNDKMMGTKFYDGKIFLDGSR